MLEPLQDGHIGLDNPMRAFRFLPFDVDRIGDDIVVTASGLEEQIQEGDRLLKKDNRDIGEILKEYENITSGSPQWKRYNALQGILRNQIFQPTFQPTELIFERSGDRFSVTLSPRFVASERGEEYNRTQNFYYVEEGIYYVNLTETVYLDDVIKHIEEMSEANGIIFDMRGYPNDFNISFLLEYLIDQPVFSHQFNVLQTIYPDQERIKFYTMQSWESTPKEPKITGEVVFLTNASAMSRPETILNIVDYYQLGTIIGQRTAGATGTRQVIPLISGLELRWTGMQVLDQDGSQLNIIGIEPDITVERKLESIRVGIDDYLETAIEYIKKKNK